MKNLFNLSIIIIIILSIISCDNKNEEDNYLVHNSSIIENEVRECVEEEEITSNQTGFILLDQGLQENGFATGIKVNEEWNASPDLQILDTIYRVFINTYWRDEIDTNYYAQVEKIVLGPINIFNTTTPSCYTLASTEGQQDTLKASYRIMDGELTAITYYIHHESENKLEILEFDKDNNIFKGRLKATFITDEPLIPDFPEMIRFFNIYIEIGT